MDGGNQLGHGEESPDPANIIPLTAPKITYETYISTMQYFLQHFKIYWSKMNKLSPLNYPPTMAPGDWDEQFAAYMESIHDSNPKD